MVCGRYPVGWQADKRGSVFATGQAQVVGRGIDILARTGHGYATDVDPHAQHDSVRTLMSILSGLTFKEGFLSTSCVKEVCKTDT